MRIIFHSHQISERGTEVALFDYALGNEKILNGVSFIAAPATRVLDIQTLEKFRSSFTVLLYNSLQELDSFMIENDIELMYSIESGEDTELLTKKVPQFTHCVFTTQGKHGNFYCPISPFLNAYYKTSYPVLPHIVKRNIQTTTNLRNDFGIPCNALVFGSYGGRDQFDISFVQQAIIESAQKSANIFFIFMNHSPFCDLPNVLFLPKSTDAQYKQSFINSCDAMIHARSDGETFGLSVAEFSISNKPIITWKPSFISNPYFMLKTFVRRIRNRKHIYATAHLDFLGRYGIYYSNKKNLKKIFARMLAYGIPEENKKDMYSSIFAEERVMHQFESILHTQGKKL